MEILNIVELIEKNPITTLSNTYNNKLLQKIKDNFTNKEQQLFVSSFYGYLNYHPKNDYVIDLNDIWDWLGFFQKANAKKVLEKNFIINIDYKVLLIQLDEQKKDGRGGHNKETILLNIKTFKLFCLKAGTSKANDIHEYFVKLEELLQELIKDECSEFKTQLQKKNVELLQAETDKVKILKEKEMEKHNLLLREFGSIGCIVYIIKVKSFENGEYIVKIGESRIGISDRAREHKSNYEECVILDCFIVNRSKDFESFLHSNDKIRPSIVNDLKNHENERELFLIGKKLSYGMLLNIIKTNIKTFNEYNNNTEIEKLKLECEKLKLLNELNSTNKNNFIDELINTNKLLLNKMEQLERSNKEILEKLNQLQTKTTNNFAEPLKTLGPRLQQINPDTLTIIKVHDTIAECIKINPKLKRSSLNKAITENTVYQGYRWLSIDRDLDSTKIHNIENTKITRIQNVGYIAKLNKEKTEIINVYLDRKVSCIENEYKSDSSLDTYVKNETLTKEHYYLLYDKCDKNLKEEFIKKNKGEPILYKNGIGQYDEKNILIKEFVSKYDCGKILSIGDKSLKKALENNVVYNGNSFKYLKNKIKCF
jgi:hypothetical protein